MPRAGRDDAPLFLLRYRCAALEMPMRGLEGSGEAEGATLLPLVAVVVEVWRRAAWESVKLCAAAL
jgi:hypothetical protein